MNKRQILARVKEHHIYLKKLGYDVICTMLQGSQNYGLDEYDDEYYSDVDTKSIVVPSLDDVVTAKQPVSAVEIIEVDAKKNGGIYSEHAEVKDIRIMFEMFKKMNISYIELLYSDYIVFEPGWKDFIIEIFTARNRISAFNKNQFLRCIAGMAYEKQKALCHPYPNIIDKIEKYGYDGKQLSHTVRLWEFISRYTHGESIADCYKSIIKKELMNYKKQLDAEGRPLAKEDAIKLEDIHTSAIKKIKDENLTDEDIIDVEVIELLDRIKYNVIKEKLRREIIKDGKCS